MDIAAGICAGRHCRGPVVTAAVDELVFERPIRMGDVVIIKASVNYAGRTSMEIGVRVEREGLEGGPGLRPGASRALPIIRATWSPDRTASRFQQPTKQSILAT